MKNKKIAIFLAMIVSSICFSISVYAETLTSTYGYYSDSTIQYGSFNYNNFNQIVFTHPENHQVQSKTYVGTDGAVAPIGTMGVKTILYNEAGARIAETPMGYNYAADTGFWAQTTPINVSAGSYYTKGITRAQTSDTSALYFPYHQYSTFATPHVTLI